MNFYNKKNIAGFTLIEILIVLGIFVLIAGLGLVVSMDTYRSYNFRSEQQLLLGVLLKARSQAVANINQKPHGVHIDQATVKYTLFQGTNYASRDASLDIVFTANPSYTLGGLTDVVFSQLTGQPNTTGSITIDDHTHPIVNISLNNEGQINY